MVLLPIAALSNDTKTMSQAFAVFEESDFLTTEHDFYPLKKSLLGITFYVNRNFPFNAAIEPHIKIH
jgi:hypothetical protein